MIWLAVAVAGGFGASARFLVDRVVTIRLASRFPWGTWVVNVTGSFLAGFVTGLALVGQVGAGGRIVVAGGFLGAYTTFSTAMLQATAQFEADQPVAAVGNLCGTLVATVAAAGAGVAVATGIGAAVGV